MKKIEVLIIFERRDQAFLEELKKQFKPLELEGTISIWDASHVVGGGEWKRAIDEHIKSASIILLLMSADLIASTETYNQTQKALARRRTSPDISVIPVLLHTMDWEYSEFAALEVLPTNRHPISSWSNRHDAYLNVVQGIRAVCARINQPTQSGSQVEQQAPVSVVSPADQAISQSAPDQHTTFDVFLCYNSKEKAEVQAIAHHLQARKITPWLDEWELAPGLPWQSALEEQIDEIRSAAVFVGSSGISPWQDMEVRGLIREFMRRRCPVIPVLLSSAVGEPKLPTFLAGMTWVDFRKPEPDPLRQLIWGITGKKPTSF